MNREAPMPGREGAARWILVAAARPNFMKIAPIVRAVDAHNERGGRPVKTVLVHTGQHYDANMSGAFFRDLDLPEPDIHLGVGSGTHGEQTGRVMIAFEKVLLGEPPDLVIVVGDVNSTMACALAAVKLHIPVAHVEAGFRSFDRTMPEEINRVVTDAVSDYLFTPSGDAGENLLREGVPREKIHTVGDIMVDSLLAGLETAKGRPTLDRFGLTGRPYALVTLHRPSNVDDRDAFGRILRGLAAVAEKIPVLFPIHPRTRKQAGLFGLESRFVFHGKEEPVPPTPGSLIHAFPPVGYLDFLNLMASAAVVLTDSGGVQQETTVLGVPCITLRDTTERPVTLTEGTNVLVHNDPDRMIAEVERALGGGRRPKRPAVWDGRTAERIVRILTGSPGPGR
ncbi:MAG TPA: UDP-N-acetylglucosamine 2-epimerase (non-hydrolyzing) [Syntrophales bacterium]|nr:UDP-N-acetylglucosamine 2-epimerase (non-hydrolyzing) [Syntrophales bacterium]HQB29694.1 UDP-N-acetylglucosamine 2-epimerase (non-hydrolyzing) [Syntrophales bacterium]HQN78622.1 UDP-N-acetylglucosamine 2-epimerase (non-hydrolyzing) [Syntrophales bacterium]HQQ27297.1 UDP-N-acetylglucosamine 2-epimerase (non-hydrolyzing) [Syntrophales bacterium]